MIWRPIMAGKVSLGEVKRGEVTLVDLLTMNSLLDFEAALHAKQAQDNK